MSGPRLASFSAALLRGAESASRPQVATAAALRRTSRSATQAAAFFQASRIRAPAERPERYGTAKEPPPHLKEEQNAEEEDEHDVPPANPADEANASGAAEPADQAATDAFSELDSSEPIQLPPPSEEAVHVQQTLEADAGKTYSADRNPLKTPSMDRVLDVESPGEAEQQKLPHLQPPPYVHHFDTFSLVRDLQQGGFSDVQAVGLMKAVRGVLGDNVDLARRALVSKSNVENESYLFRAACSELKTEIQNNRKAEAEKWRSQRSLLQHEVEIVSQLLSQESGNMKDELKGLFDDRKMAVRAEQKQTEAKLQEINYKITVALNSDARSTVESMRWLLTRRAATAIAIGAGMILASFNYYRYMVTTQEAERKRHVTEMSKADPVEHAIQRGSSSGLAEEVLLAPEGVTGG